MNINTDRILLNENINIGNNSQLRFSKSVDDDHCFQEKINSLLKIISSTPSGNKLIELITHGPHTVRISKGETWKCSYIKSQNSKGTGSEIQVNLDPKEVAKIERCVALVNPYCVNKTYRFEEWIEKVQAVYLAHEMIHALHALYADDNINFEASDKRLTDDEEENTILGIPHLASITEAMLRKELELPIRIFHKRFYQLQDEDSMQKTITDVTKSIESFEKDYPIKVDSQPYEQLKTETLNSVIKLNEKMMKRPRLVQVKSFNKDEKRIIKFVPDLFNDLYDSSPERVEILDFLLMPLYLKNLIEGFPRTKQYDPLPSILAF